ncbi:uncharacterized protein [Paramormyrops kingsleyae]|uniref:uncharacterized protein isoform X3 n=1 Tax=Paramormyrops kingsleyae TaxID=1676925 RepID=UPI003B96B7DF
MYSSSMSKTTREKERGMMFRLLLLLCLGHCLPAVLGADSEKTMMGCISVESTMKTDKSFALLLKETGSERMQRRPLEILFAGYTEREKILQGRLQEETQR